MEYLTLTSGFAAAFALGFATHAALFAAHKRSWASVITAKDRLIGLARAENRALEPDAKIGRARRAALEKAKAKNRAKTPLKSVA